MDHAIDEQFVRTIYPTLIAFARTQLKDSTRAEDVVQNALMSAMQHQDKFQGQSAFKTWIFAILKNKIVDELRVCNKYVAVGDCFEDENDDLVLTTLFNESGAWHTDTKPTAFDDSWLMDHDDLESQEFWQVLETCLENLPAEQAKVFLMKEYMELDTDEICQQCGISSQNFYVLMHRARLRLQYCLKLHWFDDEI